ncbi:hypothetical protein DFJ77DRAFT_204951 [Powellomyces hirtus]|nr:hypothetical protein DFJ77DRAFT_204951 [Powellomyces hirtus]
MLGLFVNTIVLRAKVDPSIDFMEFLKELKPNMLEVFEHAQLPYDSVVEHLGSSTTQLFNIMFVAQDIGGNMPATLLGAPFEQLAVPVKRAKFDITFYVQTGASGAHHIQVEYDASMFEAAFITQFSDSFVSILDGVVLMPYSAIGTLKLEKVHTEDNKPLDENQESSRGSNLGPGYAAPSVELKPASTPRSTLPDGSVEQGVHDILQNVLRRTRGFSMEEDMFEAGVNSLTSMRLVALLNAKFNVSLSIADVFEARTVRNLANNIKGASASHVNRDPFPTLSHSSEIVRVRGSYAQEQMWTLQESSNDNSYHVPILVILRGYVDVTALSKAIHHVATNTGLFRTTFAMEKGYLMQLVHPALEFGIGASRIQGLDDSSLIDSIVSEARKDNEKPFDLGTQPWRALLTETNRDICGLYINMHHIISDEFTVQWLMKGVFRVYHALASGTEAKVDLSRHEFVDFAVWQRESLEANNGGRMQELMAFWTHLNGTPALQLPKRASVEARGVGTVTAILPLGEIQAFQRITDDWSATMFTGMVTIFRILLSRYASQSDFAIGIPVAQRDRSETLAMPGPLINTVALRCPVKAESSFVTNLENNRRNIIAALSHAAAPFEKVVQANATNRSDPSVKPIYQVMFIQASDETIEGVDRFQGASVEHLQVAGSAPKFDLTFHYRMSATRDTDVTIEYDTACFSKEFIQRMGDHFRQLLLSICAKPDTPVNELTFMNETEIQRILLTSDRRHEIRKQNGDIAIGKMIESQVIKTPKAIALEDEFGRTMTYSELNEEANRVAAYLGKRGARRDTIVGFCLQKRIEAIVVIVGILKAGAAYLPIGPENPVARNQEILEQARCLVLFTSQEYNANFGTTNVLRDIVNVEDRPWSNESGQNAGLHHLSGDDVAYVLFTSGSTGKPKGVPIRNSSICSSVVQHARVYGITVATRYLQFANYTFDVSVMDIFVSLCYGATLCIASKDRMLDNMPQVMQKMRVNFTALTPSVLSALLKPEDVPTLRGLGISGEAMTQNIVDTWADKVTLHNAYGPTEASVNVTIQTMTPNTPASIIGSPLPGTAVYVLDENLQPVPVGIPGQLFLAGVQLFTGYLNQDDLTAEALLPDPFVKGERMYSTGDQVVFTEDLRLSYISRLGFQVKVQGGLRVELGEIDAALLSHVTAACTLLLQDKLVAFVCPENQADATVTLQVLRDETVVENLCKIRQQLRDQLPQYMIPAQLVSVNRLPMSSSGKVDRNALCTLSLDGLVETGTIVEPTTDKEHSITRILCGITGLQSISVSTEFFALGLNSLQLVKLATTLRTELGCKISTSTVFKHSSIKDLAAHLDQQTNLEDNLRITVAAAWNKPAPDGVVYAPSSYAQERMWVLHDMLRDNTYSVPLFTILKDFAADVIASAVDQVLQRNAVFRTTFKKDLSSGSILQAIHPTLQRKTVRIDLAQSENPKDIAEAFAREDFDKPFNLDNGSLVRSFVWDLGNGTVAMYLNIHHILIDEGGLKLLLKEILDNCQGTVIASPPPVQYADYAIWQRALLENIGESQLLYWKAQLDGVATLALPTRQDNHGATRALGFVEMEVDSQAFHAQCTSAGCSIFMGMLALLHVLLAGFSGHSDFAIGVPVSNQTHQDTEEVIGLFLNTIAIRMNVDYQLDFQTWLRTQVKDVVTDALSNLEIPYDRVARAVSRHGPLFRAMFIMKSNAENKMFDQWSIEENIELHPRAVKCDLTFILSLSSNKEVLTVEYDASLFHADYVQKLCDCLMRLMTQTVNEVKPMADLTWLTKEEQKLMLVDWNSAAALTPDICAHELIELQVERTPSAIALVHFDGGSMTYKELNYSANKLARHLMKAGVEKNHPVALCLDRTFDMIICILAVVKAGGAYLPLDPMNPVQRNIAVLEEAQVKFVLSTKGHERTFQGIQADVLVLVVDSDDERWASESGDNVRIKDLEPDDPYGIFYTSGSTGKPKGVELPHRALTTSTLRHIEFEKLTAEDRVLQLSTYTFDYSVMDIFSTLSSGGTLCLASKEDIMSQMNHVFTKMAITFVMTTPSVIGLLKPSPELALRTLAIGGEGMTQSVVDTWAHRLCLLNVYGPTEACVNVSIQHLKPHNDIRAIGRPLPNNTARILNKELQPVPCGVVGELYLGGLQLARGYYKRDDLTRSAFIILSSGERAYRTGDLAVYQPDGTILCLGRADSQVKIRGLRVELGEIEHAIVECTGSLCAVILQGSGTDEPKLIAFIAKACERIPTDELVLISTTKSAKDQENLRRSMKERLPAYMVPNKFVYMKALPATGSGKIDRKALSQIDVMYEATADARGKTLPETEDERDVYAMIADLVEHSAFGVDEDIFSIGMHSILAIRLTATMEKQFEVQMSVADIFQAGTVRGLVESMKRKGNGCQVLFPEESVVITGARKQLFPASSAQQKMWMLQQIKNDSTYHIPLLVHVESSLDTTLLQRSLDTLLQRHSTLRTTFYLEVKNNQLMQVLHSELAVDLMDKTFRTPESRDLWTKSNNEEVFDLSHGPLLRVALLRVPEHEDILYINIHHIVADEWSINILLTELAEAYRAGTAIAKAAKQWHYVDFSEWQWKKLRSEDVASAQLNYWATKLKDVPVLQLPMGKKQIGDQKAGSVRHSLGNMAEFGGICKRAGASMFMGHLAILEVLLYRYSGQTDFAIGTPCSTREHAVTMNLIGLFLNTITLRSDVEATDSFDNLLTKVKSTVVQGLKRKDVPFEQIVETLNEKREDVSAHPIFQVMFVLNSSMDQSRNTSQLFGGCRMEELGQSRAKFGLSFAISVLGGEATLSIEYDGKQFERSTVDRMGLNFKTLIRSVCMSSETTLSSLQLVNPDDRSILMKGSFVAHNHAHQSRCIHHLFEDAVNRFGGKVAIDFHNHTTMTYKELNSAANKLGIYLQKLGVGPNVPVGLLADRSVEMIVTMLAILKAGGFYIPMDVEHPRARQNQILAQSGCTIVVAHKHYHFSDLQAARLVDIDDKSRWESNESKNFSVPTLTERDLGYVIATSGTSTGQPKLVQIEHRSIVQAMLQHHQTFQWTADDRHLQFAAYTFDVSVGDIFGTLTTGATLCIATKEDLLTNLPKVMNSMRVTAAMLTASVVSALVRPDDVPTLTRMSLSGEPMLPSMIATWAERIRLFNGYGPTEVTVHTSFNLVTPKHDAMDLGRPFHGVSYYVLDENLEPAPFGVVGEIHIGGTQVARGYLGMPDLTSERFVYGPAGEDLLLYKTGDLGIAREDGGFTFVGRIGDGQVKIRGLRIELGEVLSAVTKTLLEFATSTALVSKHAETGEQQLIVFAARANNKPPSALTVLHSYVGPIEMKAIRLSLQKYLPTYMLPDVFVEVSHIPRNSSGKTDSRALLAKLGEIARTPSTKSPIKKPTKTPCERRVMELVSTTLGHENFEVSDDLFSVGMNSLGVMKLCGAIGREFEKEISVSTVFAGPTIKEIANYIESITTKSSFQTVSMVVPGIETITIASYAQARMWYLNTVANDNSYNVPVAIRIPERLKVEEVQEMFIKLQSRHSILRTTLFYDTRSEVVMQKLHVRLPLLIDSQTISSMEEVQTRCLKDNHILHNLEEGPLLRAIVFSVKSAETVLYMNFHHAIIDEWSLSLLLNELNSLHQGEVLKPINLQYADFSIWQRNLLEANDGAGKRKQLAFWSDHLKEVTVLELPSTLTRTSTMKRSAGIFVIKLGASTTESFHRLCTSVHATEFMGYLSVFNILLWRYAGQLDFAVGTPVSNREGPQMAEMLGMFVNTVALRSQLVATNSFYQYLEVVRRNWIAVMRNSQISFESVVNYLGGGSVERNPIFQTMFVLKSSFVEDKATLGEILPIQHTRAKFDLTAAVELKTDGAVVSFEYDADRFSEDSIMRMAEMYKQLLMSVLDNPSIEVGLLRMIPEEDVAALNALYETPLLPEVDDLVHQLVERQVALTPEAIAVEVFGSDARLTYGELDIKANKLASYLRCNGAKTGGCVALCMEKGTWMIIAMLAVLKAGCAYVPLDADNPIARNSFIIREVEASHLISTAEFTDLLKSTLADSVMGVIIDDETDAWNRSSDATLTIGDLTPEDRAYILFTSGTSNLPKGVEIEHRAGSAVIGALSAVEKLNSGTRFMLLAAYTFDVSFADIFSTLATGGVLCLATKNEILTDLGLVIRTMRATHTATTPTVLSLLSPEQVPTLKTLSIGGEAMQARIIDRWAPKTRLLNVYGPTECAVDVTAHEVLLTSNSRNIGRAFNTTHLYVLDEWMQQVPFNVQGELYIGGRQLARGYLKRPDLTAKAFVPHPFRAGETLYKTGDRVRMDPNGDIYYFGRIGGDMQIKIRGLRVELLEIQNILEEVPCISQAAATVMKSSSNEDHIVGFVVVKGMERLSAPLTLLDNPELNKIRAECIAMVAAKAPPYMVPNVIAVVSKIPQNASGKTDAKQLKALTGDLLKMHLTTRQTRAQRRPFNAGEQPLYDILKKLLKTSDIQAEDDFFAIGMTSITVVHFIAAISEELEARLTFVEVYEHPSIALLAAYMGTKDPQMENSFPNKSLITDDKDHKFPASATQERMWLLQKLYDNAAYYVPMMFITESEMSYSMFEKLIAIIVQRHSILRTTFELDSHGKLQQIVRRSMATASEFINFCGSANALEQAREQALNDLKNPFDLANGPLTRWKMMQLDTERTAIYICLHHILVDEASVKILMSDLSASYLALKNNTLSLLPAVKFNYADYSEWQRARLEANDGELAAAQRSYWSKQLADLQEMHWPVQNIEGSDGGAAGTARAHLPNALTERFNALCTLRSCTPYVGFLSLYFVLLSRHTGSDDLAVGTAANVRDNPSILGIMGPCINTLALRESLDYDMSLENLFSKVKQTVISGLANADLPYEDVIREIGTSEVIFKTMFVLETATPESEAFGMDAEFVPLAPSSSKFDMIFSAISSATGYDFAIEYNSLVLSSRFIDEFLSRFITLITDACENPLTSIGLARIMTDEEHAAIVAELNPETGFRKEDHQTPLHQMVEKQVVATPDAKAILFENGSTISYKDLNNRANQLARHLQLIGVQPGEIVAISFDKSFDMIIAMLAVLKVACAYCPIDTAVPVDRLKSMLKQSKSTTVVTASEHTHMFSSSGLQIVSMANRNSWSSFPSDNLDVPVAMNDVAYCLYTSGSTGEPKGVLIEHYAIAVAVAMFTHDLGIDRDTRHLQFAAYTFDVSVMDIYISLTNGALLCMASKQSLLTDLPRVCREMEVNIVSLTPSVLDALLSPGDVPTLTKVVTAGEVLPQQVMDRWSTVVKLFNSYGPTETTVFLSNYICKKGDTESTLGVCVPGTKAYVLDDHMQLVVEGKAGELYLGGAQLARGYMGRQDLTDELFIPNPYIEGERIYKTGDRARYSRFTDGRPAFLHFVGRTGTNFQVQIRGLRVELGEIQTVLNNAPGVSSCGVLYREDLRTPTLVAYVLHNNHQLPDAARPAEIKKMQEFLKLKLPEYMVPHTFVFVDNMPLTTTGKLDRTALMKRHGIIMEPSTQNTMGVASRKPERHPDLKRIWTDILGVEDIKQTDSFFVLGGHSLLAVKLKTMVEAHFQIPFTMQAIYNNPTLGDMASYIDTAKMDIAPSENDKSEVRELIEAEQRQTPIAMDDFASDLRTTPVLEIRAPVSLIDDGKPRLFMVHALFGMAYAYAILGGHLTVPCYGIANPHIGRNRFKTLTEMAYHYVDLVRKIQPKGPYYLGGHSAGGHIAMEMAHIFQSLAGERVNCVIMLDSVHPGIFPPTHDVTLEATREMAIKQGLGGAHIDSAAQALYNEANHTYGLLLAGSSIWQSLYDGPVTLLKAIDEVENADPFNGWSTHLTNLEVVSVRGTHDTILNVENIVATTAAIQKCIDEPHASSGLSFCQGRSMKEANYLRAVKRGDRILVTRLLDVACVNPNVTEIHSGRTALHLAVQHGGEPSMIRALIERQVKLSTGDAEGYTARELALKNPGTAHRYEPIFEEALRNDRRRRMSISSSMYSLPDKSQTVRAFIKKHFDVSISGSRVRECRADIGALSQHICGARALQKITSDIAVRQIETILIEHSNVEAVIVKKVDKQHLAFIELKRPVKSVAERENLMIFCRDHASKPEQLPSALVNLSRMPRLPNGKIDSEAIDQMLINQTGANKPANITVEDVRSFLTELLTLLLDKSEVLSDTPLMTTVMSGQTLSQLLALVCCKWPSLMIGAEFILAASTENIDALSRLIHSQLTPEVTAPQAQEKEPSRPLLPRSASLPEFATNKTAATPETALPIPEINSEMIAAIEGPEKYSSEGSVSSKDVSPAKIKKNKTFGGLFTKNKKRITTVTMKRS